MARKGILFLVHGIGEEREDWAAASSKAIENSIELAGLNPPDVLKQVPVTYNDLFDEVLDSWSKLAKALVQATELPSFADAWVHQIGDLTKADNRAARYIGDFILYRGFRLVRNTVLLRVITKILEEIQAELQAAADAGEKPGRFGVVAHSLGTAVAHDAIQAMGTLLKDNAQPSSGLARHSADAVALGALAGTKLKGKIQPLVNDLSKAVLPPTTFALETVFMVSNTSRLLYSTLDPYNSTVRPPALPVADGYCRTFFDVDNFYDPVCRALDLINLNFVTSNPSWTAQRRVSQASDLNVRHVHAPDTHDLAHYLLHPFVYGNLLYQLAPGFNATQLRAAIARLNPAAQDYFPEIKPGIIKAELYVQAPTLFDWIAKSLGLARRF